MRDYGLVSVVMPTWNCDRFIAESIRSVQAQSYGNWELLIVDDCSTDNTKAVVARFDDSRIKYHCLECNSGAAVARNTALRMARGRWIAFLDSDDLWRPEKLERQLAFMVDNGYAFSYHNYVEIDEGSKPLGVFVSGKKRVSKLEMFSCCWAGCLSVMYDAEKIGLIQIENVKKNNDTAMWLKVVKKAPCYLLDEDLALYRRRANSITPKPVWQRIWAHYPLFRVAERMNPVAATFWVGMNVIVNTYKKLFYVKKMNKVIQGWSITCPKCGTVNEIIKEDLKYPARSMEVLYCAKCNEILGHKNSTVSLDTKVVTDNKIE